MTSPSPPDRPLRVAHVTEQWIGGIATHVCELVRHQHASPVYETPHLICDPAKTPDREIETPVHRHHYTSARKPWRIVGATRSVRTLIEEIDPDVVHLHSSFPGLYGRLLRSRGATRPVVVYCAHGWSFTRDIPRWKRRCFALAEQMLAGRTDAIVHISRFEAAIARSFGIAGAIDRTIRHGARDSAPGRRHVPVPSDRLVLGFVGRLDRQKGIDRLLDALERCARSDVTLLIAGGRELEDLPGLTLPSDGDAVRYLGWIPNTEIDDVIGACDAVVVPSRWEGFGLVVIEAMRNGKPVLVSDRGALPELVVDGATGFVFALDATDELARMIDGLDKRRLGEMGRLARTVYERSFSLDRELTAIDALYREALRRAAQSAEDRAGPGP